MINIEAKTQTKLDYQTDDVMNVLFHKLDEAIDDMEQERVQTIEEAWAEIDAI